MLCHLVQLPSASHLQVSNAVDTAYPELLKASAELQSLYAVIDAAEVAVGHVLNAAAAAAERFVAHWLPLLR
jgi:hypothetical protein